MEQSDTKPESKYPESDRLLAVREPSQAILEFIEWLTGEKNVHLCEWDQHDRLDYVKTPAQKLVYEFFGLDSDKLDQELRQMLEELRTHATAQETTPSHT